MKNQPTLFSDVKLEYICDNYVKDGRFRPHLVCLPYSIENLHRMAKELKIHKCFFHGDHYDIPVGRVASIMEQCKIVDGRTILLIVGRTLGRKS